jgi:hypothetical protein
MQSCTPDTTPSHEPFLKAIAPYRGNLVVGVECIFCWYWIADLCAAEQIEFVLGHALYMKAIHGGKAKNDKIAHFTHAGHRFRVMPVACFTACRSVSEAGR